MYKLIGGIALAALFVAVGWWLLSVNADEDFTQLTGEAFGTRYRITYASQPNAQFVQQAVDQELARIDAMASTWRDDSELMRYNRTDDSSAFPLSPELAGLIEQAETIETQTNGAFSPRPSGDEIDLSGIAKGYAVDRVIELLAREYGITHCMVDIGGEVRVMGHGRDGDGWRVGIYMPAESKGLEMPVVRLHDTSIATSGAYLISDHILNPTTGKPVRNNLLSVSVVHPSNATADALATALFVMGLDQGMAWAEKNGVRVIFLLKDGTRRDYTPKQ